MAEFVSGFMTMCFGISLGAVLQTVVIFKFYNVTRKPFRATNTTNKDG